MKFRKQAIFLVKRVIPFVLVLLVAGLLLGLLFFDSIAQTGFKDATADVPGDLRVKRFSPGLGGVTLKGVQWTLDSKEPVFEASEVYLDVDFGAVVGRDWYQAVRKVVIHKPGLRVTVDPNGNLNLLNLLPATAEAPAIDLTAIRTEVELQQGWILYNDRRDAGFLYELAEWSGKLALFDGESLQFSTSGRPNGDAESLFGLNGRVALLKPEMVTEVTLENFDLEPFTGFPGFGPGLTYVRGVVDGSVRATGEGENWNQLLANIFLVGEVKLDAGAFRSPWMPASFTELAGQAKLLGSGVSSDGFAGRFADIDFEVAGRSELGAEGEVDARVSIPRFDVDKLNVLLAQPLPVQGQARVEVSAKGRLEELLLSGSLYGYDLQAEEQTVTEARADFLKTQGHDLSAQDQRLHRGRTAEW